MPEEKTELLEDGAAQVWVMETSASIHSTNSD